MPPALVSTPSAVLVPCASAANEKVAAAMAMLVERDLIANVIESLLESNIRRCKRLLERFVRMRRGLACVNGTHGLYRIRLVRCFVWTVTLDARKPKRGS